MEAALMHCGLASFGLPKKWTELSCAVDAATEVISFVEHNGGVRSIM